MPRGVRRVVPVGAAARGIPPAFVELLLDLSVDESALTLDTTLEDLSFDSLDVVELAMACEEAFGIDVSDRVLDTWPTATLQTILNDVRRLGAKV